MHELHIGELSGGFTVYWFERGKRRRFRLAAKTRKDAVIEAQKVYRAEIIKNPQTIYVRDAFTAYVSHLKGRVSEAHLSRHWKVVGPFFGNMKATDVSPEVVGIYIGERKDAYRARWGKEISDTTVHHELTSLKGMLNHAKKLGAISDVPWFPIPPQNVPERRGMTEEEIYKVLAATRAVPHAYLAVILMLGTGARVTAALELTWDRVDFAERRIDLRKARTVQMKRRAVVPMNDGLYEVLCEQKKKAKTDHVIEWRGRPVKSLNTAIRRIRRDSGVDIFCAHVLRHTAAVQMIAAGTPIAKVSQFLGHKNTAITESVYARFLTHHFEEQAEALDFHTRLKSSM